MNGSNDLPTLVDWLRMRAAESPEQTSHIFLHRGEAEKGRLSYHQLDVWARRIAVALGERGKVTDRAVLMLDPSLDYVAAFMGCQYAGWLPVPAFPPEPSRAARMLLRLGRIIDDARPRVLLTTTEARDRAGASFQFDGRSMECVEIDALAPREDEWRRPEIHAETIGLIQYTSGSVGQPNGTLVTHANLLSNLQMFLEHEGGPPHASGVSWAPPHHDMGLIGGLLRPIHGGFPMTLMAPIDFLRRPIRWPLAMSKYKATVSVGPNFAYSLCCRSFEPSMSDLIDLGALEVLYNGAEPVRADVLDRFCEMYAPFGFRRKAFATGYGLAEHTLIVSAVARDQEPVVRTVSRHALTLGQVLDPRNADDAQRIVSLGGEKMRGGIRIVDPDTQRILGEGRVGEVWLRSTSVAAGYWQRPKETNQTFHGQIEGEPQAGGHLRTGDLGFMLEDQLYIVDRMKDLIIVHGQNHYPSDIEATVETVHPSVRAGGVAAFSVERNGAEAVVVVAEFERHRLKPATRTSPEPVDSPAEDPSAPGLEPEDVAQLIREAVVRMHEVPLAAVMLVKTGQTHKTTSGKIQRRACRAAYLSNGGFHEICHVVFSRDSPNGMVGSGTP